MNQVVTPDFTMTEQERHALAKSLRTNGWMVPNISPEMEADLAKCAVEELAIPTRVGPSRVMLITPPDRSAPSPLYINFHGGGFVRGYHARDTIFCAQVALATGALVLDVDYRLAPEHPFPTALHECYDVVRWAFNHSGDLGVARDRIVIGGHSAGGNLATVISIMANSTGDFRPHGQFLDYPFLDALTPAEQKLDQRSAMPASRMLAYNVLYAGVPEKLSDPRLSPLLTEAEQLKGLPTTLMLIAGLDPLRHEAQQFAAKLISADVDVETYQFAECDHAWVISAQKGHERARTLIFDWLNRRFNLEGK